MYHLDVNVHRTEDQSVIRGNKLDSTVALDGPRNICQVPGIYVEVFVGLKTETVRRGPLSTVHRELSRRPQT